VETDTPVAYQLDGELIADGRIINIRTGPQIEFMV